MKNKLSIITLTLLGFASCQTVQSSDAVVCRRGDKNCTAANPTLNPTGFIEFIKNQIAATREALKQPQYSQNGILTPAGQGYLKAMLALLQDAHVHYTLPTNVLEEGTGLINELKNEFAGQLLSTPVRDTNQQNSLPQNLQTPKPVEWTWPPKVR